MIARLWIGRTLARDADAYLRYLEETGVAEHRRTPGNRGSWVLRRIVGKEAEFQVISLWESANDVKAFAGDDIERAVYFPEDDRYLLEKTPTVAHYEIFGAGADAPA